jgi:hypothetical protein
MRIFLLCLLWAGAGQAAEVLKPELAKPADGSHALTVQRDRHFGVNGLAALVIVDGVTAASVNGGEAIAFYVPDGRHTVGIQSSKKSSPDMSLAVDVGAGHEPILEASVSNWGWSGCKLEEVR